MKRLAPERKCPLIRLGKKRWRKRLARSRYRKETRIRHVLELAAPFQLSFSDKDVKRETLKFIHDLRDILRKSRNLKKRVVVDFRPIRKISVPAAIAIAAEFYIWRRLQPGRKYRLALHRPGDWAPRVFSLFYDLGVFRLLGIQIRRKHAEAHRHPVIFPFLDGDKVRTNVVQKLVDNVQSALAYTTCDHLLYAAVVEAVSNVVEHAYPDALAISRAEAIWLATACRDTLNNQVMIVIYDRGIGIPDSLRKKGWFLSVLAALKAPLGNMADDAIIQQALQLGESARKSPERGKGLAQMQDAVQTTDGAEMRIISAQADVCCYSDGGVAPKSLPYKLQGTMIVWKFPVNSAIGTGAPER